MLRRAIPPLGPTQWLAWCLAGVRMFAAGSPSVSLAQSEATRVAMVLAMLQTGRNITRAAALLQTSRKSLRDRLKRAELYPWPLGAAGLLSETVERS